MKSCFYLMSMLCLALPGLRGQVPVTPAPPPGVAVEVVQPTVTVLDPVVVRRHLSIAPRVVVVPAPPPPVQGTVPVPPAAAVEAYNNSLRRVYNPERRVVVVQEKEERRELSYVTLPVLFEKETAELLDAQSRADLKQVADVINDISSTEAGARFDIEGHTSTDGTDEFNMNLSVARAQRVYDELTQRYGVAPGVLTAHGYGENYPMYPKGTEEQMQQDRRVLVVRSQ